MNRLPIWRLFSRFAGLSIGGVLLSIVLSGMAVADSATCDSEHIEALPQAADVTAISERLPASGAEPLFDYADCGHYVSSSELEKNNQALIQYEKGFFVAVPKDYSNPALGQTRVYAHFAKPFDPKKPTYAMFTGGPGQSSHLQEFDKFPFYANLDFNFLLIDQRGIGFSRFETEADARDARNYGSEATARDMLKVLNQAGIEKVSIYGTSYGTVPATIFGSLFPEKTRSVVLEGVLYDGWSGTMSGTYREKIIQKFIDSLEPKLKARVIDLVDQNKIPAFWIPTMMTSLMSQSGGADFEIFREALKKALIENRGETENDILTAWTGLANDLNATAPSGPTSYEFNKIKLPLPADACKAVYTDKSSEDVNQLLHIKEFGGGKETVSSSWIMKKGRLERTPGGNYSAFLSKFTHLNADGPEYTARNYSVRVPMTYFQGEYDGATPAEGAIRHFEEAAQGQAQLFLFDKSSHTPTGLLLWKNEYGDDATKDMGDVFSTALTGKIITCEKIKKLGSYKYGKIELKAKNAGPACD